MNSQEVKKSWKGRLKILGYNKFFKEIKKLLAIIFQEKSNAEEQAFEKKRKNFLFFEQKFFQILLRRLQQSYLNKLMKSFASDTLFLMEFRNVILFWWAENTIFTKVFERFVSVCLKQELSPISFQVFIAPRHNIWTLNQTSILLA